MKTITINNCNECHFLDHSGAFTPGGAKPHCNNQLSCGPRIRKHWEHWKNRILKKDKDGKIQIPTWCPL